jgi:hypothetical protein
MESSFASRYGEIAVCSAFVIAGGVDSEDLKHPPKIGSTDKPRNIERKIVFIFYLCPYVFCSTGSGLDRRGFIATVSEAVVM